MLRAILTACALGLIAGQATLDYVFPEVPVTEGFDAATWKPCPGRKPQKVGKRKLYWYCGPDDTQPIVESRAGMGASAAPRSAAERTHSGGTHPARGHR